MVEGDRTDEPRKAPRAGAQAAPVAAPGTARVRHLYVHVPFCVRKCEYCAFYSEVITETSANRYVSALVRELELVASDLRPRTVFFGGGTPSLLTVRQWETVLEAMRRLGLLGAEELTIEANPSTVSLEKARLLRSAGVNRISMGVQSLDETMLARLGRIHTRAMVFRSFDTLRRAGFENVNLDLMFGIPGQTLSQWRSTLREALALGSEHLSSYEVIYEEDTALFEQLQAGRFEVNEDLACDMFELLIEQAAGVGFHQYEVANFARHTSPVSWTEAPDRACRHNVNYWRGGSFYGVGPSATSYVRGTRSKNWSHTGRYTERLARGERAVETTETLSPLARAGETAAFGLRMNAGWPFDEFERVTSFDLRREWQADLVELEAQGLGQMRPDRFRLTDRGLRLADLAAERFLRPD